jgi:hypothetical protein
MILLLAQPLSGCGTDDEPEYQVRATVMQKSGDTAENSENADDNTP